MEKVARSVEHLGNVIFPDPTAQAAIGRRGALRRNPAVDTGCSLKELTERRRRREISREGFERIKAKLME